MSKEPMYRKQPNEISTSPDQSSLGASLGRKNLRLATLAIITALLVTVTTTHWTFENPFGLSATQKLSWIKPSMPRDNEISRAPKKNFVFLSRKIGQVHQVYMEARALDSHTWEIVPRIEFFSPPEARIDLEVLLPSGYHIIKGQNPINIQSEFDLESISWIVSVSAANRLQANKPAHVVVQAKSEKGAISSWSINLHDEQTWSPHNTLYSAPRDPSSAEKQASSMSLSLKSYSSPLSIDENSHSSKETEEVSSQPPIKSQKFRPQSLGISQ